MSADPGLLELYPSPEATVGGVARIEVPAFAGADVSDVLASRLLVRLVDRRTSDPVGHGLLTPVRSGRAATRHRFQAVVPLAGRTVGEVHADVYDALSGVAPVLRDRGTTVREARCATTFLGEWRRLLALARLPADRAALADQMGPLAERLRSTLADATPFPGCPPVERVLDLLGKDPDPVARLRAAGADVASDDELGFASGVGSLLVAEVVAAGAA
jgi:hypothetical protein